MSNQMPKWKNATCRGSYALGSACGHCERCAWEREHPVVASTTPTTQSREAELAKALSFLRRFVACETNYDDLHVEAEQWLDDLDAIPAVDAPQEELAEALKWALDRLPACVAMPTSHDFNQYEKYRVLASTTPAPVGDESPSLANARREGAEAALRVAADRLKYYGHSANLVDEIRAIDPVTILAQHREVKSD